MRPLFNVHMLLVLMKHGKLQFYCMGITVYKLYARGTYGKVRSAYKILIEEPQLDAMLFASLFQVIFNQLRVRLFVVLSVIFL